MDAAYVSRVTDPSGVACFCFMIGPASYVTHWSSPPIASGRWTRCRLAAYWLDGFTLVPMTLSDRGGRRPIEDNLPREGGAPSLSERMKKMSSRKSPRGKRHGRRR